MIPRDNLEVLITKLAKVQTQWITKPRLDLGRLPGGPYARIILSMTAYRSYGSDEYRQKVDAQGHPTASQISGQRAVTLSMRCESIDPTAESFDILEKVRAKMMSFTTQAFRAANNMSFIRVLSMSVLPSTTFDNRAVSTAVMDMLMGIASNVPVDDDDGATIDTVNEGSPGQIIGNLLP